MNDHKNHNDDDNNDNGDINEAELGSLLENTFNDFCKIYNKNESSSNNNDNNDDKMQPNPSGQSNSNPQIDSPFRSLYGSDNELKENWSKLAKSCNQTVDNDLHESLLSTLKIISDKAESISNDETMFSNDEMAKMMANLAELQHNYDDDDNKTGDSDENIKNNMSELNKIMPLMSNIMENLLSKDFLYPTLSELRTKYPTYLAENQSSLSKDDYNRYESQLKIIRKICEEFENDDGDDGGGHNDEMKSIRFNRILSLMQTMQSFGTPPTALVSGGGDGNTINSDMMMFNNLNAMNNGLDGKQQQQQCQIM
ncbi:Peroxisome chaperone and import receptor [Dermatophagoides farinae]|uniref:Peroxin-19 n=1 Tax=Dermatophagoides farinae TaxID=6954 RepID=A0A922L1Q3_DERFA|nr:Peroxisome chaperone and import receptor [Dermatophagoides farinae]